MYLIDVLRLPSSISWCEDKYIYSDYIAEYWNTITGLFLCISAICCIIKNDYENIQVLYKSNILLFIVGIGTMMFHGTLIYTWQLLDEIPMMLIVIEYYRILTDELLLIDYTKSNVINYNIIYYLIPIIILSYYIHPKLQVVMFQGTLSLCIILLIYTCYKINKNLNKLFYKKNAFNYVNQIIYNSRHTESEIELHSFNKYKKKRISRKTYILCDDNTQIIDTTNSLNEFKKYSKIKNYIKYHNYQSLSLLIFSLFIWNIDNNFCQNYIKLHAIWHITTSIGMYSCNEIIRSYILLNKQLVQK
jgi:hypothetical protein